ncbi:MAG TPA: fructosamine kinase family protein [Tepidisphaeraceae bacterium]|jgi:fructosamine-3-kinase|nr:fructosamine kinase family protein [Tepidisphaeraceae bacterium]
MTPHEVDISWQVLRGIARQWAGDAADVEAVTPLAGGSINTTLAVVLKDGRKAVLKITPHRVDRSYTDEAWQLALLKEAGLPVPEVYLYQLGSLDEPFSYILMEFIEGMDLAEAKSACAAGEFEQLQIELASYVRKLHERTHSHFQRAVGGENVKRYEKWHECYREFFDPIWHEVEKSGVLPVRCRKVVGKVHERLERFLTHDDCPRLLHWDLWSTNLMCHCKGDGQWHIAAFLDPHCKYGHAEAELAYLELFHTVTPAFMKAYQQTAKLAPEYHQVRKPVYQLYSMLNDLRLFGQEYLKPTLAAIDRVGHLV